MTIFRNILAFCLIVAQVFLGSSAIMIASSTQQGSFFKESEVLIDDSNDYIMIKINNPALRGLKASITVKAKEGINPEDYFISSSRFYSKNGSEQKRGSCLLSLVDGKSFLFDGPVDYLDDHSCDHFRLYIFAKNNKNKPGKRITARNIIECIPTSGASILKNNMNYGTLSLHWKKDSTIVETWLPIGLLWVFGSLVGGISLGGLLIAHDIYKHRKDAKDAKPSASKEFNEALDDFNKGLDSLNKSLDDFGETLWQPNVIRKAIFIDSFCEELNKLSPEDRKNIIFQHFKVLRNKEENNVKNNACSLYTAICDKVKLKPAMQQKLKETLQKEGRKDDRFFDGLPCVAIPIFSPAELDASMKDKSMKTVTNLVISQWHALLLFDTYYNHESWDNLKKFIASVSQNFSSKTDAICSQHLSEVAV